MRIKDLILILGGGGSPYLLDNNINASNAYSFRRLSESAIHSCQLRKSDDNSVTDVLLDDFDSLTLDSKVSIGGALGDWIGFNSAYLKIWYDQSKNISNLFQNINDSQAKLINLGSLITKGGLAALSFDGVDDEYEYTTTALNPISSYFNVASFDGSSEMNLFNNTDLSAQLGVGVNKIIGEIGWITTNPTGNKSITYIDGNQLLITILFNKNGGIKGYSNQILMNLDGGARRTTEERLGSRGGGLYYLKGTIQEHIIFSDDKTSQQSKIENEIKTHYSI